MERGDAGAKRRQKQEAGQKARHRDIHQRGGVEHRTRVSLPTLDTLARIAEAIGVSLGMFFDADDQQPPHRAELETKLRLILRELGDRDAEIALGLVDVLRRAP
jgi:transcriptional regulator with XRE-family HTH domain